MTPAARKCRDTAPPCGEDGPLLGTQLRSLLFSCRGTGLRRPLTWAPDPTTHLEFGLGKTSESPKLPRLPSAPLSSPRTSAPRPLPASHLASARLPNCPGRLSLALYRPEPLRQASFPPASPPHSGRQHPAALPTVLSSPPCGLTGNHVCQTCPPTRLKKGPTLVASLPTQTERQAPWTWTSASHALGVRPRLLAGPGPLSGACLPGPCPRSGPAPHTQSLVVFLKRSPSYPQTHSHQPSIVPEAWARLGHLPIKEGNRGQEASAAHTRRGQVPQSPQVLRLPPRETG